MKKLFKTLFVGFLVAGFISACNKDDNEDYLKQFEEQELRIDSILNAQKIKIEEYVDANLADAKEDSIYYNYRYINKKTKRGIWYRVESEPTDNTYEYKVNSTASALIYPVAKLKYSAKLLDGTEVESDETGSTYNFGLTSSKINSAWIISFFPYAIKLNGDDIVVGGLTKNGLKKGSKITVVTPSPFAYGSAAQSNIPANSPLVYEFEVLEIE